MRVYLRPRRLKAEEAQGAPAVKCNVRSTPPQNCGQSELYLNLIQLGE
ncbi:hypothetical protein [Peribacillus muralis]